GFRIALLRERPRADVRVRLGPTRRWLHPSPRGWQPRRFSVAVPDVVTNSCAQPRLPLDRRCGVAARGVLACTISGRDDLSRYCRALGPDRRVARMAGAR